MHILGKKISKKIVIMFQKFQEENNGSMASYFKK
jgi:hypothetical protein